MADEKTSDAKATEEPKIDRDRLIAEAHEFMGYAPHEVAGALASERKQTFTVAEAKKLTERWLKSEVEVDQPDEEE